MQLSASAPWINMKSICPKIFKNTEISMAFSLSFKGSLGLHNDENCTILFFLMQPCYHSRNYLSKINKLHLEILEVCVATSMYWFLPRKWFFNKDYRRLEPPASFILHCMSLRHSRLNKKNYFINRLKSWIIALTYKHPPSRSPFPLVWFQTLPNCASPSHPSVIRISAC